jgi:hypothetical protein
VFIKEMSIVLRQQSRTPSSSDARPFFACKPNFGGGQGRLMVHGVRAVAPLSLSLSRADTSTPLECPKLYIKRYLLPDTLVHDPYPSSVRG